MVLCGQVTWERCHGCWLLRIMGGREQVEGLVQAKELEQRMTKQPLPFFSSSPSPPLLLLPSPSFLLLLSPPPPFSSSSSSLFLGEGRYVPSQKEGTVLTSEPLSVPSECISHPSFLFVMVWWSAVSYCFPFDVVWNPTFWCPLTRLHFHNPAYQSLNT